MDEFDIEDSRSDHNEEEDTNHMDNKKPKLSKAMARHSRRSSKGSEDFEEIRDKETKNSRVA